MDLFRSTTTTPTATNSTNRSPLRRVFFLIPLVALACSGLSSTALAVSPAPDGGYANNNTAEGTNALFKLTSGADNTASGFEALFTNTTGGQNTAVGSKALVSNTTAFGNTAAGYLALVNNSTGQFNVAIGWEALLDNTTGGFNTALGAAALLHNTSANGNTAVGVNALFNSTTGHDNTATGVDALDANTTGTGNVANGSGALFRNTTGGSNIAVGTQAGSTLTTGSNNIDIGNQGVAAEANTIRIGTVGTQTKTFIAGISAATASGGAAVFVNSAGQLGTLTSSARFKEAIKPMDKASEAILVLKPVRFRYKKEIDPDRTPQFGLVAEDVEKVNPDLVARDADGKTYTVRYEAVNAMLLNEFLKEHRKVEELEATVASLVTTVKQQALQIQKVNAQLELNKPAPQTVLNNQ